ncbi:MULTISPECIES: DUF116 domain-containing protein [unclassified Methanobrevibacter]|jgi:hypothetical protein|uniref:DUF116 domain-containing protein n=1 Tax=unclassified Methanobrevibacter TaxID=2638681 RepID=UPI0039B91210
MITESIFIFLGELITIGIILLLLILIITLVLGKILIKKNLLIFPKVMLLGLDAFYSPLKKFSKSLGLDKTLVDHIGVELRNKVNEKKFNKIPNDEKLIFLPHCLRAADCEAKLTKTGVECTECGRCSIGIIKSEAEPMGYTVFIVPGSSFIERIIKEQHFKAVVGIACYEDLNLMMMNLSDFAPQGVLLTQDGCFLTKVNVKEVLDKIGYEKQDQTKQTTLT